MLEFSVVAAVIIALLRGGKLERLADLTVRKMPLVILALLLRILVNFLAPAGFVWLPWLQIAAYVLLLAVVWLNIRLPGLRFFGVGSLLNFIVIAVNGGRMPVVAVAGMTIEPSGTHTLLSETTRLWFLADIFPLRPIAALPGTVLSVGDFLIMFGVYWLIQHAMLKSTNEKEFALAQETESSSSG